MKVKLSQVKRLIQWLDDHEELVKQFFPKMADMKLTLPKMRKQDKELVVQVMGDDDDVAN
jgi:hypothetical protein